MLVFLAFAALADPADDPVAREDQSLRDRTYATVDGDGPVRGRWRRRSGDIVGSVFPDGTFEHYTRREGGEPQRTHWYSGAGVLLHTLDFVDGAPSAVEVHAPALPALSVADWDERELLGLALRVPGEPALSEPAPRWTVGAGTVELHAFEGEVDPLAPEFARDIARSCACELIDRHTAWIDGEVGIRLLLEVPSATPGERAELWAVAREERVVALWARWTPDDPSALSTLRAMVAQATWPDPG